jgi:DNA-binding NtrC family response regulator
MEPKFIVVDNDIATSEVTCSYLLSSGFHAVRGESDPSRVVDLLQSQTPIEAAIISVSMPNRRGQELLAAIKENSPSTECIVTAEPADKAVAIRCLSVGAFGCLVKPFTGEELVAVVALALERRALLDTLREDALLLGRYYLKKWGLKGEASRLDASAAAAIAACKGPDLLSKLEAGLREAVESAQGKAIALEHLPERMRRAASTLARDPVPGCPALSLAKIEKQHILKVYGQMNCNKVRTARALGIGLNTLRRKLKVYNENKMAP